MVIFAFPVHIGPVFDTLGTIIVATKTICWTQRKQQAAPRGSNDAVATCMGAVMGTNTVTTFVRKCCQEFQAAGPGQPAGYRYRSPAIPIPVPILYGHSFLYLLGTSN